MSAKHTLVNRKFRIDNQPGARHSVILDDSPIPNGRRAKLITQIALVDMSLPDSEAILNMFANAPETLRQHGELLSVCRYVNEWLRIDEPGNEAEDRAVAKELVKAIIAACEATKT